MNHDTNTDQTAVEHRGHEIQVLIAGGGVAGLEAAFALQEFVGDRVHVRVISTGSDFAYRPLSVGEPFNRSHMMRFDLEPLVNAAGAELVRDALVSVEPKTRCAQLASGSELPYDALLVATGACLDPIFPHATTIDPQRMDELLHGLVQDIEEDLHRLAVVIPRRRRGRCRLIDRIDGLRTCLGMQTSLDVTLITPEAAPLEVFGETVTKGCRRCLTSAGSRRSLPPRRDAAITQTDRPPRTT